MIVTERELNEAFDPTYTEEDKANRYVDTDAESTDQREDVLREIGGSKALDYVLQLPTGFGKCRIAIETMKMKGITDNILIVVPKLVLIDNWKDEFKKWDSEELVDKLSFTTYLSLDKNKEHKWELVIFDECHHLSDAAYEVARKMKWNYTIWLSATMNERYGYIEKLVRKRPQFYLKKVSVRQAIGGELLPDPKVYLMRMRLDNTKADQFYEMNTNVAGEPVIVPWKDRFQYFGKRELRFNIQCTQVQYLEQLNSNIAYARKCYDEAKEDKRKLSAQNYWLHLCSVRLNYLSRLKEDVVRYMVDKLGDKRVVIFCGSIEQSERLCENSVNSKKKGEAQAMLDAFNEGKINHISSCNMLNEGVNLVDCQYGVYAALNSSETLIKQKLGRLLRHENPILIIPFYVGTREEEIVQQMVQDYSRSLVALRDAPVVPKQYTAPSDGQWTITLPYEGTQVEFHFEWQANQKTFNYRLTDKKDGTVFSEGESGETEKEGDYFKAIMEWSGRQQLEAYEEEFVKSYFKIPESVKPLIFPKEG